MGPVREFFKRLRAGIRNRRLAFRNQLQVMRDADIRNLNRIVDEQRRTNQALTRKIDEQNERWQEFVDEDRKCSNARMEASSASFERQYAALKNDCDAKLAAERLAAQDAIDERDSAISRLEAEVESLGGDLAAVKHKLELKDKALEVATDQNETLWDVIERDRARVQAERHAYQRSAAEAESASRALAVGEVDE